MNGFRQGASQPFKLDSWFRFWWLDAKIPIGSLSCNPRYRVMSLLAAPANYTRA